MKNIRLNHLNSSYKTENWNKRETIYPLPIAHCSFRISGSCQKQTLHKKRKTTFKLGKYVNLRHCLSFQCGLHIDCCCFFECRFEMFAHPYLHKTYIMQFNVKGVTQKKKRNKRRKKTTPLKRPEFQARVELIALWMLNVKMYRFQWVPEFCSFSRFNLVLVSTSSKTISDS